jgi:hypothetical protein
MQAIALLDRYQNKDFADAQELLAQLYFKSGRYAEVEPRLQKARHVWMKDMAAHRGPLSENLLLHAESLDALKRNRRGGIPAQAGRAKSAPERLR